MEGRPDPPIKKIRVSMPRSYLRDYNAANRQARRYLLHHEQQKQNYHNTARENDASMIVSGIARYISAHSGNLPQTVGNDTAASTQQKCLSL